MSNLVDAVLQDVADSLSKCQTPGSCDYEHVFAAADQALSAPQAERNCARAAGPPDVDLRAFEKPPPPQPESSS